MFVFNLNFLTPSKSNPLLSILTPMISFIYYESHIILAESNNSLFLLPVLHASHDHHCRQYFCSDHRSHSFPRHQFDFSIFK